MSLDSYVRAAPKAELHVHLEGAIRPATLFELAARNGVSLPATSEAGLREWFTYRDFNHFVEIFVTVTRCLRTAQDYELSKEPPITAPIMAVAAKAKQQNNLVGRVRERLAES